MWKRTLSQRSTVVGEWSGRGEQSGRGPEVSLEEVGLERGRGWGAGGVGRWVTGLISPGVPRGSTNALEDDPFEKIPHCAWCPVGD